MPPQFKLSVGWLKSARLTATVLTEAGAGFQSGDINVHFSPEIQAKLDRAAAQQGRKNRAGDSGGGGALARLRRVVCSPGGGRLVGRGPG
jgi:hypothetical protein